MLRTTTLAICASRTRTERSVAWLWARLLLEAHHQAPVAGTPAASSSPATADDDYRAQLQPVSAGEQPATIIVAMMHEHGLVPRLRETSPIDLDEVAALALRVVELERLLEAERAAHAAGVRERDERWKQFVERVRREGQLAGNRAA